jgi:D-alanyl-D-alanine carboxypeptidase
MQAHLSSEISGLRMRVLPVSHTVCWLMAKVALAGFVATAQHDPLPPGTLTLELWPKSDSLVAPPWPRLRGVNLLGQAFELSGGEALRPAAWPGLTVLTSDSSVLLWTDESPQRESGFYALTSRPSVSWATNLQRVLKQGRSNLGARGAGAAVIGSSGVLWSGVSGFDFRTNYLHPQLRFGFASVTKTFTGALILEAAEQGKLTLDDSLSRWSINFRNITNTITLRQLLNHTSGLDDYDDSQAFWNAILADLDRWWSLSDSLQYVLAPRAQPGQSFRYSALTGFALLGLVIEKVQAKNLPALLNEALLGPCGLNQIHPYSDRDWKTVLRRAERAHGYAEDGTDRYDLAHVALLSAMSASADLYGTAEGLARWGRLLYGGEFLKASSRSAMMEETPGSQNAVKLGDAVFADAYGLATCIYKTSHGAVFYGHAGQAIGYRVFFGHAPAVNTTVVVWINREVPLDRVLSRLFRPMLETVQDTN